MCRPAPSLRLSSPLCRRTAGSPSSRVKRDGFPLATPCSAAAATAQLCDRSIKRGALAIVRAPASGGRVLVPGSAATQPALHRLPLPSSESDGEAVPLLCSARPLIRRHSRRSNTQTHRSTADVEVEWRRRSVATLRDVMRRQRRDTGEAPTHPASFLLVLPPVAPRSLSTTTPLLTPLRDLSSSSCPLAPRCLWR